MDVSSLNELIGFLDPEADEAVVVNLVTAAHGDVERLLRGAVIIGPPEMARTNWTEWRQAHGVAGPRLGEPKQPTYIAAAEGFRTRRVATDFESATTWLQQLLRDGRTPAEGDLPSVTGQLRSPSAPVFISPRADTDASTFMGAAVRPGHGFRFPDEEVQFQLPKLWQHDDQQFVNAPLTVGLHCPRGAPGGLVVARLQRRAWLNQLRGGDDLETFDCHLGLDPNRIDVSELVISLDEWADGELVVAQQIRLDDLEVDVVRGERSIVVQLPTLGTRAQRTVLLHDLQGNLLDRSAFRFSIVESVDISVHAVDVGQSLDAPAPLVSRVTVGERRPVPPLLERAVALDRVRSQYTDLFARGVDSTLIPVGGDVHAALARRLAQARGILRVVDRYFGKDDEDWELFADVKVPVEVLTSLGKPPASGLPANVTVRRYTARGGPEFHGRGYLWTGGGVAVDASPNGFGRTLVHLSPLTPAQSEAWQAAMSVWWAAATPVA